MQHSDHTARVVELLRFTEAHRRHTEALARVTGEHFNIFRILRVGHLEVKTHSPILGELLNPKGQHGQGATFLRLFLSKFNITDFDAGSETASVKLEYSIGPVTDRSGGRIDIVVWDGKDSRILIENKIYAQDGENQLKRYRDKYPRAHLFYLTLNDSKPSKMSEDDLKCIRCERISYATEILAWLKECRKEAACLPGIREVISQYIHLIEELTNQSTTTRMNNDLIKAIVGSRETLDAFFTLYDEREAVHAALIKQLDTALIEIAAGIGLKREGSIRELNGKDSGFYFSTPGLLMHNLQIGCAFENGNYKNFYYGFAKINSAQECPLQPRFLSVFLEEGVSPGESTKHWPAWAWWEDHYRYWGRDAFESIRSGAFAKDLKARLEMLAKIARCVCPDDETGVLKDHATNT